MEGDSASRRRMRRSSARFTSCKRHARQFRVSMGYTAIVATTLHRLSGLYAPSLRGRLSANTAAMQRAPDTMQHYTVITIYTATTRWQQP